MRAFAVGRIKSGINRSVITMPMIPIGTLIRKIQCQLAYSPDNRPPAFHHRPPAARHNIIPAMPSRRFCRKRAAPPAAAPASTSPAHAFCTTWANTNSGRLGDAAASAEPPANKAIARQTLCGCRSGRTTAAQPRAAREVGITADCILSGDSFKSCAISAAQR